MSDQTKNVMIGIFVIAAFAIMIFIVLFIHPSLGNEGKVLRVRFSDIDKITPGTRVTFGGKPVGEVIGIKDIDPGSGLRLEHDGIIYIYELTLGVDSDVTVYTIDEITSRTSGLLGEKTVAITPMPPRPGEELIPVTDQTLYSIESGSVESTLKEIKQLSDKLELALDSFNDAFHTLKEGSTWKHVSSIVQNINDITDALNKPDQLTASLDDFAATLDNTKVVTTDLREGKGTMGKFFAKDDLYNNLIAISDTSAKIVNRVNAGEGTLGKIVAADDLYLRLSSLFSKAEVILNDVNHYGILFNQDKGWKRLRARRLNLMQELSSPQQFRNYFNDEIDNITTSLERVAMVMQKSDEACPYGYLLQNPEYAKVYAELLRRVGTLEEYLEMYNQQVVDCEVRSVEFE